MLDNSKRFVIIFNGEIIDMAQISTFSRRRHDLLRSTTLQDDIDRTILLQDGFHEASPRASLHQIDGNHEDRLKRYLGTQAREIGSLRNLLMEEVFHYEQRGFASYRPYGEGMWLADNLFVYHGSTVAQAPGQSVKKDVDRMGASVIVGHVHRRSHTRIRQGAHEHAGIENGCLCQVSAEYSPHTNWTHCITFVRVYDNRHWKADVIDIITDPELGICYADWEGFRYSVPIDYDDGMSLTWNPNRVIEF